MKRLSTSVVKADITEPKTVVLMTADLIRSHTPATARVMIAVAEPAAPIIEMDTPAVQRAVANVVGARPVIEPNTTPVTIRARFTEIGAITITTNGR